MGFYFKWSKKERQRRQRERVRRNAADGKKWEDAVQHGHPFGPEHVRTGIGHDSAMYSRDLTGKRKFYGVSEQKASPTAPLSELQKKAKKRYGPKYHIDRATIADRAIHGIGIEDEVDSLGIDSPPPRRRRSRSVFDVTGGLFGMYSPRREPPRGRRRRRSAFEEADDVIGGIFR
jgi:hypothetical protein